MQLDKTHWSSRGTLPACGARLADGGEPDVVNDANWFLNHLPPRFACDHCRRILQRRVIREEVPCDAI